MRLALSLWVFLVLLLSGCQVIQSRQSCVSIDTETHYCLQGMAKVQESNHELNVVFKRQQLQHEMLLHVEIQNGKMIVVGLAPIGQALFTLTFDGEHLVSEHNILLGKQFNPEYILALLQIAYWPELDVKTGIEKGKLIVSRNFRQILSNDMEPVIQIDYSGRAMGWDSKVTLSMPKAQLILNISPLESE
ncbi:DUF3261 domain-containing protein [Parashewanella curva]|uniref:DUF3261 domain-containing protein n=1 Tax=Parashewanella curva TaxID=2338552 RepID=A0A3L8Q2F1_9GAMM|nr:DUF3261 domain-containing protein [Parashewanella curva]RLV60532.1 DUF3261 domain-containing protein [Parashewanella curva]